MNKILTYLTFANPPNGLKSTLRMIIIDSSVLGQEASQLDLEFWPPLFLITVIVDARNHHHHHHHHHSVP